MPKRHNYALQETDEVERLRQVRRDFEQQFKTLDAYFDNLMTLQKEHDRRLRVQKENGRRKKKNSSLSER